MTGAVVSRLPCYNNNINGTIPKCTKYEVHCLSYRTKSVLTWHFLWNSARWSTQ